MWAFCRVLDLIDIEHRVVVARSAAAVTCYTRNLRMIIMTTKWKRGSEWRKWDLHLHAPGTKLNDQFGVNRDDTWDEYCRVLHQSDVEVFGITDYFSGDVYFKTIEEFKQRYPDSEKVFFCNIELRLSDVVNPADEEVNIHLIFNSTRPDFEKTIQFFLRALKTNKTEGEGRKVNASELSKISDFESATTTRESIRIALEETFGKDADLLDHLLIITAANNNGIRAKSGRKRKLLITYEIDKFSHGFFGNAGNVDYFLKTDRGEDQAMDFSPKPVLSGCDAHSHAQLQTGLGQVVSDSAGIALEPTWIKADLTFEGLKQIIFEPSNRVYIGEEPEIEYRVRNNKTRYIDKLNVTNIGGYRGQQTWFRDEEILLGKELVAIIGNKGSGKSAVTDIIGLLGNSYNQMPANLRNRSEELFSFLNSQKFLRKGYAANFTGELTWHDGSSDCKCLDEKIARTSPEKVEYLPQKYLERICSNIDDDEFRLTLDEVVFRYVRLQDRFGQPSLSALIGYLTQQTKEEIQDIQRDLHLANERVVSVERKLVADYKEVVDKSIRLKKTELAAHESIRPPEKPKPSDIDSSTADAGEIERLTQVISRHIVEVAKLKTEQGEVSNAAEELRQVKQAIDRESRRFTGLKSQYDPVLMSAGLSFDDIVRVKLDYKGLDTVIARKAQRLEEIGDLLATEQEITGKFADQQDFGEAISAAKSRSVVCTKAELERKKAELVERQAKPAREYQAYRKELTDWVAIRDRLLGSDQNPSQDSLKWLQRELENIKSVYPEDRRSAKADQIQISKQLFEMKRGLTNVYDQIKQSIDKEIVKFRADLGDYLISIEAGLRFESSFFDKFLEYINQGRKGSFHGSEEGKSILRKLCDVVDDWENESQVFSALNEIVDALHFDIRSGLERSDDKASDVFTQMRNQQNPVVDLYDYLFGFDYLNPKYDLRVDGKDLSELSPGERGGLLLIFYLILDRRDVPLVIDQPEDNLDNKSVYEILVTFIKRAKTRRQIILVTHNPNLAVVADAEQIIRVSIDKKDGKHDFDAFSGSIESPEINRAVVDILEGTLPAFDNRRLKYRR